MKLLVTGFEDFMGFINPTKEIAKALDGLELNGVQIRGIVIPVSWEKSSRIIDQHIEEFSPDALVSFGLNTSCTGMTLETKAHNIQDYIRDATGKYPMHSYIQQNGPYALPNCLPTDFLCASINASEGERIKIVPNKPEGDLMGMSLSNDAGGYLCNNVFYNNIYHQTEKLYVKGFIHIQGQDYIYGMSDIIQSGAFAINALTEWMMNNTAHTTQKLIN